MARKHRCQVCRAAFSEGYTIAVVVSTIGRPAGRTSKHQVAAELCEKCAIAPGARRTRPGLWKGLRVAIEAAMALRSNVRDLLAKGKSDKPSEKFMQNHTKTIDPECNDMVGNYSRDMETRV